MTAPDEPKGTPGTRRKLYGPRDFVGPWSLPSPAPLRREEREQESLVPKATCGVIRMGVAPPRGGRERGSEGGNRRCASTVHAHRTNPHPKSTGWSHRATGGASHPATPRRGNPPGSSAGRRRNAADDGVERTRTARGLRSVRKKPSPGARAIGESEERQEGSGCGDAEPATDEEQTFEGQGAREPPAHDPRWTHRKVWSTNDRRRINPANPRSGASCKHAGGRSSKTPSRW